MIDGLEDFEEEMEYLAANWESESADSGIYSDAEEEEEIDRVNEEQQETKYRYN